MMDDGWIDERLPCPPLKTRTVKMAFHFTGWGKPSFGVPQSDVHIERDSAGVKAIHYANGDTDYRDIDGFIEGLESQIAQGELQAEFDAWDAASDEALRDVEERL